LEFLRGRVEVIELLVIRELSQSSEMTAFTIFQMFGYKFGLVNLLFHKFRI